MCNILCQKLPIRLSPYTSLHASSHTLNQLLFPENATLSLPCLPFCCFIAISLFMANLVSEKWYPIVIVICTSLITNLNDLTLICYITTAYFIGFKLGWNELRYTSTQKDSVEASLCHWRIPVPSQTKFSASSYDKGIHCLKRPWRFQYAAMVENHQVGIPESRGALIKTVGFLAQPQIYGNRISRREAWKSIF